MRDDSVRSRRLGATDDSRLISFSFLSPLFLLRLSTSRCVAPLRRVWAGGSWKDDLIANDWLFFRGGERLDGVADDGSSTDQLVHET